LHDIKKKNPGLWEDSSVIEPAFNMWEALETEENTRRV
jgi:hypothetical protein